jgi:hypothetical protein
MSRITIGALLLVVSTNAAAQTAQPTPVVVLRTYKFSISAQKFAAVRQLVEQILDQGGVGASWLQCWSPDSSTPMPAACNRPLGTSEVILKIVPTGDANSLDHPASLGYSYVDMKTRSGSVATVYVDRVKKLARSAGVKDGDLLGRAIAHEIGHLLLGTNQHSSVGLMRAVWSGAELRRNVVTDWVFSEDDAHLIRRALVGS